MAIVFYEYGNSVTFNKKNIAAEHACWEEEIEEGDRVIYHDSVRGARPFGKVISISTYREYLLIRLAGYEMFVILKKLPVNEYIVLKSDIGKLTDTSGKRYYEGKATLQKVYWELDPDKGEHLIFLWYLNDEHRMTADIVNLQDYNSYRSPTPDGELVAHISGRYKIVADDEL